MAVIKYENVKLRETSKSGRLKRDADGYYDVILGAMNTFNSRGEYYAMEGAEEVFNGSSTYHRLISQGKLYGEHGHPRPGSMSGPAYLRRLRQIHEDKYGTFFKSVTLDDTLWKRYPGLVSKGAVIIMGKVMPYGAFKETVSDGLSNPDINFAYSVRSFTDNYRKNGRVVKVMKECITWDSVGAQGIGVAEKYCAPGLESHEEIITVENMREADRLINEDAVHGLESSAGNYSELILHADSTEELDDVLKSDHIWRGW